MTIRDKLDQWNAEAVARFQAGDETYFRRPGPVPPRLTRGVVATFAERYGGRAAGPRTAGRGNAHADAPVRVSRRARRRGCQSWWT